MVATLRPHRAQGILVGGGFALLVFLAFGRSLWQGFAPIDDSLLVTGNLAVHGLTWENIRYVFTHFDPELYIPLTFLSYQIDYAMWRMNPVGFHVTNLILHIGNSILIYFIFVFLTRHSNILKNIGTYPALFCAGLFAVHPLHTEAVAWVAGRKDVLFAFFFLLAFNLYIRSSGSKTAALRFSNRSYGVGFFLLALLAKVTAATLPVVLVFYDLLIERKKLCWGLFKDKIPYFILSFIFIGISVFGKERVLASSTVFETVLMAGKSTMFYLQKLVLPLNLSVFYPYHGEIALTKPEFLIPAAVVLMLLGAIVFFWNRNPLLSFGLLFFLVTLTPTFLNFHKGEAIFFAVDRYAYVPSVGIIFGMTVLLYHWRVAIPGYRGIDGWLRPGKSALLAIIFLFIFLSFRQTRIWDTAESLFENALKFYPQSVVARTDLARVYREQGKIEQAFNLLKEGLAYGDDPSLRLAAGLIYARTGQVADAREQFLKARELKPDLPDVYYALGTLEDKLNLSDQARGYYQKAIDLDESFVAARVRLARILREDGAIEKAKGELIKGLKWNPSTIDAHLEMAGILLEEGSGNEARKHIERVLRIDPMNSLARSLISQ